MNPFEVAEFLVIVLSLGFIGYQSVVMRRTLGEQRNEGRIQSYLQIWMNHIEVCHLSIATADDSVAEKLNAMSPYYDLPLPSARQCHFADAVLDTYECIDRLGDIGILDAEVARLWRESIPYEMSNPVLREHWHCFHHPSDAGSKPGIYHRSFVQLVEEGIDRARQEADSSPHPTG